MLTRLSDWILSQMRHTGLSYLHCHRIEVLSSHTFSTSGISYLNMVTRSHQIGFQIDRIERIDRTAILSRSK